jgi:hypothetical protein
MKRPKFKVDESKLKEEIKVMGNFEDVSFGNSVTNYTDSTRYEMTVQLLNGTTIPKGDSLLKALGKKIMTLTVAGMENSADFDYFSVVFVEKIKAGPMTYTNTNPFKYRKEELK